MAERATGRGPTILADPFRPFFLLAALFAGLAVPLWLVMLGVGLELAGPLPARDWHVHEMLFGFLSAVMAGFLFTAIPNWTGRLPLHGSSLLALVLLWMAGRIVMAAVPKAWLAGVVDGAFLVTIAGLAWREVAAGRNWRNAPVCLLVTLYALANVADHVPRAGLFGERLGFGVAAMLIALIGGRIVPSFTRNWLAERDEETMPSPFGRFDRAAIVVTAVALLAWTIWPYRVEAGGLLILAGLLHGARLARWRAWRTMAEPLLMILHVGYLWLVAALLLIGLSALFPPAVDTTASLHALTAGAIGTMTLAVMTRASLGHTGRELTAGPATLAIYILVVAGGLLRVLAPQLPLAYDHALWMAGALWSGAFLLFAAVYGPLLATAKQRR